MRPRQIDTFSAARVARHHRGSGLSSARLTSDGDDLNRARLFCLKAGQEMTAIIDADRSGHTPDRSDKIRAKGRDPVWLCERLGIIQREAKRARARAIYRSAQDALSLIQRCNAHMPIDWTRVDGRLFVLNKLLGQYEQGLLDVETKSPVDIAAVAFDQPATAIDQPGDAQQTLQGLLPHASDDERKALTRLIALNRGEPSAFEADDTQSPTPELSVSVPDDLIAETPAVPAVDRIEWIMTDLVQALLELGREYAKIFSISHSLDHVLIKAGTAADVSTRLYTQLSDIIASNLPLQGVGRIDICAHEQTLLISGSGFDSFVFELPERVEDTDPSLGSIAAAIELEAETPPAPPMITDDVEGELRAQLSALMDGVVTGPVGSDNDGPKS